MASRKKPKAAWGGRKRTADKPAVLYRKKREKAERREQRLKDWGTMDTLDTWDTATDREQTDS